MASQAFLIYVIGHSPLVNQVHFYFFFNRSLNEVPDGLMYVLDYFAREFDVAHDMIKDALKR